MTEEVAELVAKLKAALEQMSADEIDEVRDTLLEGRCRECWGFGPYCCYDSSWDD